VSEANSSTKSQRFRIAAAAIVSVGLLAPLAIFGGTGWGASGSSSAAQYQYKITICHHTHSTKHPTVTIRVSVNAWPAHKKHGDTLGPCTQSKSKKNHGKHHGQSSSHGKKSGHSQSGTHSQGSTHSQSGSHSQSNNGQTNGATQGKGHGK
jgi:hypothetical protein